MTVAFCAGSAGTAIAILKTTPGGFVWVRCGETRYGRLFCHMSGQRKMAESNSVCVPHSAAFVAMVEAADPGHGHNVALFVRLDGPGFRAVHS